MQAGQTSGAARRYIAYLSSIGTTQLHLRNPFTIAFWSLVFPGLGHLLLSKYFMGFILFVWEVVINVKANINLAILYSLTGRFEMAKDVIDKDWVLLYLPTYMFAIWDSYRTAVDINCNYTLAAREDAEIISFNINAMEINYLNKRKPWVSAVWSSVMPGLGQLYIHRIVTAMFVGIWWITIIYFSKALPAIHYSLLGQFDLAKQVVDPHWLLNIPSIYLFAIYDSYVNTVENNKLFDWEQTKFLKRQYQAESFILPNAMNENKGDTMHIVSTFEHSQYLELAITALQMKGVAKEDILAVPLDKAAEDKMLFDTIYQSDGLSLFDLPMILATFLTILGSIYGFVFEWGPVIWGLIGLAIGFSAGLIIKLLMSRKYNNRLKSQKSTEVVLIIKCDDSQMEKVRGILWANKALGVSKLAR